MENTNKEMSFIDHLEQLRWHFIRSAVAIIIATVVAFIYKSFVVGQVLLGPTRTSFITYQYFCKLAELINTPSLCITNIDYVLQSRQVAGQFTSHITISLFAGFIVAFPYIFFEIWQFIKPALHKNEQNYTKGAVASVSILFLTGVAFGYFILSPLSVNFLANYKIDESIANQFDMSSYFSMLTGTVLACGLLFQLPMVILLLTKIGIITPDFLRKYRRHAILVLAIAASILTPSPDVFSMLIVATPLVLLYEASIIISAVTLKRMKANEVVD